MFLLFAGALAVVGCGRSSGTVTGTVTYKGAPLKGGSVVFIPPTGGEAATVSAQIGEDGTYTAEKVPVGDVKVTVDTSYLKPARTSAAPHMQYSAPPGHENPNKSSGNSGANYVPIPPKYADPAQTPLKCTVKSGSQKYDIPLD
jgi:hypothetical protein